MRKAKLFIIVSFLALVSAMFLYASVPTKAEVGYTCTDSDTPTYPSINIALKGTATSESPSGIVTADDYCYNSTGIIQLVEYYCVSKVATGIAAWQLNCAQQGYTTCVNGKCV